jgi:hypothetical protein
LKHLPPALTSQKFEDPVLKIDGSLTFLKYVGTDRSFILIFFKYPEPAMLATDVSSIMK